MRLHDTCSRLPDCHHYAVLVIMPCVEEARVNDEVLSHEEVLRIDAEFLKASGQCDESYYMKSVADLNTTKSPMTRQLPLQEGAR